MYNSVRWTFSVEWKIFPSLSPMDGTTPAPREEAALPRSSSELHPACESVSDHSHATDEQPQTVPVPLTTEPAEEDLEAKREEVAAAAAAEPPWSVFPSKEKAFVIIVGSFAALISPLSSSIYLPALNSLAHDMDVSVSLINLTITTYLVCIPMFLTLVIVNKVLIRIVGRSSRDWHRLLLGAFPMVMAGVLHTLWPSLSTSEPTSDLRSRAAIRL